MQKKKRSSSKKSFIAENYRKCLIFFKEIKWYFVFSVGVFALFFLIGFIFPVFFREEIILMIKNFSSSLGGKGIMGTIFFIFFNNLRSAFFSLVFGIGVAVFPMMALVFNGYLLGFVGREVAVSEGIFMLWKILPHGIFELPAIFLSTAIGIKIGIDFLTRKQNLKYNYKEGLRFFGFVILLLLLIAATIEGLLVFLL